MKQVIRKQIAACLFLLAIGTLFITGCQKDSDGSPDIKTGGMSAGTLNPASAAGGEVITLKGSGIGQIRSIVFDKNNVPAPFMSTLNTETDLVFRVPDTAFGGPQNVISVSYTHLDVYKRQLWFPSGLVLLVSEIPITSMVWQTPN